MNEDTKTIPKKCQCQECKFIFYNATTCPKCGSSKILMVIED